jgi:hypothetical protein
MELFTLPEEKPQRAGEVYTFSNGAKVCRNISAHNDAAAHLLTAP